MSAATLPPPRAKVCLTRSYASRRIKGGTVIAEDVRDLETHRRKILDPDEYRATIDACWACGSKVLHALCMRERTLRGALETASRVETVRLYRCALKTCGAVFTVLPAVIARHLWRLWQTVEDSVSGKVTVPESTQRRWLGRLCSSASRLLQTIAAKAASLFSEGFVSKLSKVTTRLELVEALRSTQGEFALNTFAVLAAWIHRLEPGVRLM